MRTSRLGPDREPWNRLWSRIVELIMNRKVVGLALFGVALAAAAAGAFYLIDAEEDPGNAPQDSFVFVDFTRSGGFTGITQHLLVYSDGEAELTTGESAADAKTIEFDLAPNTLKRLEHVLPEAAESLSREKQAQQTCADCYQYDLTYEETRYTFFDLSLPPEATDALNVLVVAIREGSPQKATPE